MVVVDYLAPACGVKEIHVVLTCGTPCSCCLLQGTSIELVITYLRKWLRIERTNVGRLLWTYPFDYSLPRLVLPNKGPSVTESWEDTASSTSGSSEGQASAGQTALTAEEAARSSSQQQNPDEQLEKPPLGSPDRCTWLELPSQKKDRDTTDDGNPDD